MTAPMPHMEKIDVEFSTQTTFSGIHEDDFDSSLGSCTMYWNVTGTKKN